MLRTVAGTGLRLDHCFLSWLEGNRWEGGEQVAWRGKQRVRVGVHVEEAAGAPCGEEMGPEESACRGGSGGLGRGAALVAYVRPLPPERPLCHL